jgi:hypothetical protein
MSVLLIILGVIVGIAIAWILNRLLANKIENKDHRLGLKVAAYIVCVILGAGFALVYSLHAILDDFMNRRLAFVERELAEIFPDSNILEREIDTSAPVIDELRQLVNNAKTSDDGFLENVVFNAFLNKLNGYFNAVEDGVAVITTIADDGGPVTVKAVSYRLKDIALETIAPYFVFGQIGILFLLLIFIGIYVGFVIFLKKGGAMYNKSIVFGDNVYNIPEERSRKTE